MIFDKTENWHQYFKHDIFIDIYNDLKKISIDTVNGTHFKNNNYYFKVMSYTTKDTPAVIENHRKEVDIQILLSGSERIKLYSREVLEISRAYSKDDDSQFYKVPPSKNMLSEIKLQPEYMAVFFNQDIHQPQFIGDENAEKIKKIVIKVNEEFFTH